MPVFGQLKSIFRHEPKKTEAKNPNLPVYKGLEDYTLLNKMGVGAFSIVYRSLDHKSNQEVAIKVIHKQELSRSLKANVLKEAQIMRTLDHPSITKLLVFKETSEYYYLILELMGGGEIFHQLAQLTYFSEDLTRHCIKQVAEGIRYLHEEKGVVHRDIKPENILFEKIPFIKRQKIPVTEEPKEDEGECVFGVGGGGIGRVKLADFGLSKIVWNQQTMTPCGTVGYTAPEIVRDERYSKSVDMWALGCVMYTMLCGFPPFYDESISKLTNKVSQGQFTFLSPWWDPISNEAKDLIRHLLEVQPKKRYTIDQFLAHPWLARWNSARPVQTLRKGLPFSVSLKNTFDVSYAVHRINEERAYRKENKQKKIRWHLFSSRHSPEEKTPIDPPLDFELNLSHSTLLGRRGQRLPA